MSRQVEFQSTVKGGLPVLVVARIHAAEPDVGIFGKTAELEDICWPSGKPITAKAWNSIPEADLERLMDEALDHD